MLSLIELYYLHLEAVSVFLLGGNNFRLGVIGAGAAGLGAYRLLKQAGFKNLTLIEGRSRIGGRVHSITTDDGLNVDLGASWLHGLGPGAEDNTIWDGQLNPLQRIL